MTGTIFSVHTTHAQAKNERGNHLVAEKELCPEAPSAEVVPFPRSAVAESKAEYVEAIHSWLADRQDVLSREEIASLKAFDRLDAQRKALIMNLALYFRKHPRSDVAPGVATVITLLSDNAKGACTVSQQTMAKLFGRSRAAIADAQSRLRDDSIIVTTRGRTAGSHPVIPRAVTKSYNHMTWMIDAVCASEASQNCLAGLDNFKTSSPAGQFKELSSPAGHIKSGNCQVEADLIVRPDLHNFTNGNSSNLNKAVAAVAVGIATAAAALPAAALPSAKPIVRPADLTPSAMHEMLLDAAGKALRNPAASPGLLVHSELHRWLEQGCDFHKDILPTIKAVAAKARPASLSSWTYFTDAVSTAKARRCSPLPEAQAQSQRRVSFEEQRADAERAALARDVERIRGLGPIRAAVESLMDDEGDRA